MLVHNNQLKQIIALLALKELTVILLLEQLMEIHVKQDLLALLEVLMAKLISVLKVIIVQLEHTLPLLAH